ncbi:tripartite motif-containing protein 16-like isoform X1 [Acipenser ruthenus]|uniref:tripartite motif-containing protein 16-like isoform X1 n=1 Tax=Acipenser ruthenus TaxID=7906 RepID=UPI00274278EF|nr:tripartite motif-containing protein 16-like isoform X1 [Acipenser ruthenus]
MAEMISEEQFVCSVCLEILKEPVTIQCGHSFCTGCIKKVWDQAEGTAAATGSYSCPQCKALFSPRPVLCRNTVLAEVVEKLRKSPRGGGEGLKPGPAAAGSGGEEVPCDFCTGTHSKALKSCLVCLASYCETHLQPHRDKAALRRHRLIHPVRDFEGKLCESHQRVLEVFCRTDQTCICVLCTSEEHASHTTVSAEKERTEKQEQLGERRAEIHKRIQERLKELEELKQAVESLKNIEKTAKEKAVVSQADELMDQLEQEITELKRRDAEMEQLSKTEDHIHFLQNCWSFCAPPESGLLPSVTVNTDVAFEAVRKAVSELKGQLEGICKKEFVSITQTVNKVSCQRAPQSKNRKFVRIDKVVNKASYLQVPEPKNRAEFLQYSCQLTLDPNTPYTELRLSEGNRKVSWVREPLPYPDHPERFDCELQVLCTEGLSGTRCYWEIEWSGCGIEIGVTYKGISRKGGDASCQLGRNNKSWSLWCSVLDGLFAWHNNKEIKITAPRSSRIGVYLDCPAGTLSFYSVFPDDTMTLLHRFYTTFTEPLYPGFRPYFMGSINICQLK